MKKYSEMTANSDFIVVPNAGHLPPVENPEFLAEAIHKFLSAK